MGIVNNAVYASYFEIGRTELFRDLGIDYASLEQNGLMLTVNELYVKYHRSARYDEELTIETSLPQPPTSRLRFDYKILRGDLLLTEGYTVLAFIDATSRKPIRTPKLITEALSRFFSNR